jgi:hypothetical protein
LWFRWPIGLWPGSGSRRTAVKALLRQGRRIVSHCEQNSKFIPNITSPSPNCSSILQDELFNPSALFLRQEQPRTRFAAFDGDTASQQLRQSLQSFLPIDHHSTLLWQRASPLPLIFLSPSAVAALGRDSNPTPVFIAVSQRRPFLRPQTFLGQTLLLHHTPSASSNDIYSGRRDYDHRRFADCCTGNDAQRAQSAIGCRRRSSTASWKDELDFTYERKSTRPASCAQHERSGDREQQQRGEWRS